jgi:hypothetical protein
MSVSLADKIIKLRILLYIMERAEKTFTISEVQRALKRRGYDREEIENSVLDLIDEGFVDTLPEEAVAGVGRPTVRFRYVE